MDTIAKSKVQVIWQTGGYYHEEIQKVLHEKGKPENMYVTDFIARMDQAYKAADLVISRAGASSISELCLLGKASILVPSPNVAEDHQTCNAMALVRNNAAVMVRDAEAREKLMPMAIELVGDDDRLKELGKNAYKMAYKDSANIIAQEVIKLAKRD